MLIGAIKLSYTLCSINYFFFAFVVFLISSLNYNRNTFFIFINFRFVRTFSFSLFSLVSAFTWISKASRCFLWRNSASMHFLFVVSQISTFYLQFYNYSSCNFNYVVLPLSSSFSSYNFLMNILFLCSTFALFFLQISTLCLYPFWKSLSLSNSSCNIAFSFSFVTNLFFKLFTSKVKFPIFRLIIPMVWNNSTTSYAFITFATTSSKLWCTYLCHRISRSFYRWS